MVGFSFSPKTAVSENLDPQSALRSLLSQLRPDLVRLPVYWDQSEPWPGQLDFSQTDALLATVAAYNDATNQPPARVMLVVGARNLGTPEAHVPSWAVAHDGSLRSLTRTAGYRRYLEGAFSHFAANPLLYAWQVENEPLDNTNPWMGDVTLPVGQLEREITRLREIDRRHQIVVTTYDSATLSLDQIATSRFRELWDVVPGPRPVGHPQLALGLGDVLGLDAYVVTPATPLNQVSAQQRITWKSAALGYWSRQASQLGKQLWITEMQGAPWAGRSGFTLNDLLLSAVDYRTSGATVVLLWGVEQWLASSRWMWAGQRAMDIMRGNSAFPAEVLP
jgi:hypothetical protein